MVSGGGRGVIKRYVQQVVGSFYRKFRRSFGRGRYTELLLSALSALSNRMPHSNIARDAAFGVVPILLQDGSQQFLLIQHHAGHWGFPKGHADPGETDVQAACREFTEETGIAEFRLLEGVAFTEQYTFMRDGRRYEKTVVYYPAFVDSATVNYQKAEIKNYAWATYERAISLLTFSGAKQVLTDVHQYLADRSMQAGAQERKPVVSSDDPASDS